MELEITALGLEQAFVAITERDNGDGETTGDATTMEDAR
jgi:hypothetical protein